MPRNYKRYTYKNRRSGYYNKQGKRRGNIFYRRARNKTYWMAKKALSLLNVEKKNHDLVGQITPGTTASIQQITNIPQGDTTITRDGGQVRLTSLDLKYTVKMNTSATRSFVRVILVQDKQTNQAIFTLADLLEDATASDNIVSMLNLNNKYRFKILYNEVIEIDDFGTQNKYRHIHKKLDMRLRFDASTPSIADLTSNSLALVFINDEATNFPTINFFNRVRYIDN